MNDEIIVTAQTRWRSKFEIELLGI